MVRAEGEPSGAQSPPHWFFAYANPDCRLTEEGGFLSSISWDVGKEAERPLAAGQRLYLRSITKEVRFGGSTMSWSYCTNVASFVPEAGRRYRVQHELTYPGCRVVLVQQDTNRPPPSFRLEVVSPRCGEFNQRDDGDTATS